jgi:hypothetical protein
LRLRLALQRNATLTSASTFQYFYLAYFSRPAHHRVVYRTLRRARVRSIVEIGVGTGQRAMRLLAVAQRFAPQERLSYAGIDLFEARPAASPGIALKEAHRQLTATGAQVRLVPGDPFAALARSANALTKTDLLIIAADQDAESLERAWFYVPRMLHESSLVFLEEAKSGKGEFVYRRLSVAEIAGKAQPQPVRRAA